MTLALTRPRRRSQHTPRDLRPFSGKVARKTFFPAGKGGEFCLEPFEDRPVFVPVHIDQPGNNPDGILDTLGTDGSHERQDRPEGRPLTIGPQAICDRRLQRRAKLLAGDACTGPRQGQGRSAVRVPRALDEGPRRHGGCSWPNGRACHSAWKQI